MRPDAGSVLELDTASSNQSTRPLVLKELTASCNATDRKTRKEYDENRMAPAGFDSGRQHPRHSVCQKIDRFPIWPARETYVVPPRPPLQP